jgi:hypothetical protein
MIISEHVSKHCGVVGLVLMAISRSLSGNGYPRKTELQLQASHTGNRRHAARR